MIPRPLPFFCLLLLCLAPAGAATKELPPGSIHRLTFRDVDGDDVSTSDGHVTILTVITRENEEKARAVADLIPDRYVGDPKYRYVTLVNFQRRLARPFQGLTRAVIRHRLESEARELRPKYVAKKLTRDPRHDIYVIADFDGAAVEQLGLPFASGTVAVFVFNGAGRLIARWSDVPPGDSLPRAIAEAG